MPPTYAFYANTTGRSGSTDEQAGQELSREFEVETDDETLTAADVIAAAAALIGVAKGTAHPTYPYAFCTRIGADPVAADPMRWVLKANYKEPLPPAGAEINPGGGGAGGGQPQPEDRDPEFGFTFRRQEVFRLVDVAGTHWLNSAGDLLEDPPPTFEGVGVINVVRYYATVSLPDLANLYLNHTNEGTYRGFPQDSLLVTGIDAKAMTERGWRGYRVAWTLEWKGVTPEQPGTATGGWRPTMVLDRGWNVLVGGDRMSIADLWGQTRSAPGLLDGAGSEKDDADDPVYLPFVQYERVDFAYIG